MTQMHDPTFDRDARERREEQGELRQWYDYDIAFLDTWSKLYTAAHPTPGADAKHRAFREWFAAHLARVAAIEQDTVTKLAALRQRAQEGGAT